MVLIRMLPASDSLEPPTELVSCAFVTLIVSGAVSVIFPPDPLMAEVSTVLFVMAILSDDVSVIPPASFVPRVLAFTLLPLRSSILLPLISMVPPGPHSLKS